MRTNIANDPCLPPSFLSSSLDPELEEERKGEGALWKIGDRARERVLCSQKKKVKQRSM